MKKTGLNELRAKFLDFFEKKGHLKVQSYSLVPENDPGLLLINAGMAPLKPYFKGEQTPPCKRMVTCQKCIRTLDIENVGKTSRHATFFEMLGNFSFGDYFKDEAISWAWEFCTDVLELPVDKIWISIYTEDDEANRIWNEKIGVPDERIVRLGKEDNFWEHGEGPCGPCSELYYDRGEENGCGKADCKPGCDCDRFVEFWNNVFTQFDRQNDGSYKPLAKPNIDTGLGLERLACLMQGVNNIFEVDTIKSILDTVCALTGKKYGRDNKTDVSIRIITEHIRGAAMMIGDGIKPSNEGRGYILRRLIRRASGHGRMLGVNGLFLSRVVNAVIDSMGDAYPVLREKTDYIKTVLNKEEEIFSTTVDKGMNLLNEMIQSLKAAGKHQISGEDAFRLHDTFGFSIDLTREIAEENGLGVDVDGFELLMTQQREMARNAIKVKGQAWDTDLYAKVKLPATVFTGYIENKTESRILFISNGVDSLQEASEGDDVVVVLDKSPFYAVSGGQIGDTGVISAKTSKLVVTDTSKTSAGVWLHSCRVHEGTVKKGDQVTAEIDAERRRNIERNHTTTHLLQKALQNTVGIHAEQAGSSVDDMRLRFDFTHFSPLTHDELSIIEDEVNSIILQGLVVSGTEMTITEAKKSGATALFGEKYGETVRVISAGNYSMELCGGTHLTNTSQAGLFKIISESGVAAGTRRIEGVTGKQAIKIYADKEAELKKVMELLKCGENDAAKKLENLLINNKNLEKELADIKKKSAAAGVDELISKAHVIGGVKIVSFIFSGVSVDVLRETGDRVKDKSDNCVVIFLSISEDKVQMIAAASPRAVSNGVRCGDIIKVMAKICGGGGGGRPDMAQAGGKDASKADEALKMGVETVKTQLSSEIN